MEFRQSSNNLFMVATETFENLKLEVVGDLVARTIKFCFYKDEHLLDTYPYWLKQSVNNIAQNYIAKKLDKDTVMSLCSSISKVLPQFYEDLLREVCIYDGNSDFKDRIN